MIFRQKTRCVAVVFSAMLAAALGGCSSHKTLQPIPEYRVVVPQAPGVGSGAQEGAIFAANSNINLFEDMRAHRIGDILTVTLKEKTVAKKDNAVEIKKENTNSVTNPLLLGSTLAFSAPGLLPLASNRNNGLGFSLDSSGDFSGDAKADQSNSLTGSISVMVTDVLPNGNLVIQGDKYLTLTQGNERVAVAGIVRPTDIAAGNVIESSKIANVRISYEGDGDLANAGKMGWLARFFNTPLMPF